jgi:hypothetical protein
MQALNAYSLLTSGSSSWGAHAPHLNQGKCMQSVSRIAVTSQSHSHCASTPATHQPVGCHKCHFEGLYEVTVDPSHVKRCSWSG